MLIDRSTIFFMEGMFSIVIGAGLYDSSQELYNSIIEEKGSIGKLSTIGYYILLILSFMCITIIPFILISNIEIGN